jgi:hypothetical protein
MVEGRQNPASANAGRAHMAANRPGDVAALIFGGAGLLLSLAMLLVWLDALGELPPANSDFVSYYVGGALFSGGYSPYDRVAELALRSSLTGLPVATEDMLFFLYPPAFLVVVLPFVQLGLGQAALVWGLCQLVALTGIGLTLCRHLPSRRWLAALCWLPIWLPVAAALKFGQVSLFFSLGLVLCATASGDRPWAGAAAWLLLPKPQLVLLPALAWLLQRKWHLPKPQLVLLPALAWLVQRKWQSLLTLAAGCVAAVWLSLALVGLDGVSAYLGSLGWASQQLAVNWMWRVSTYTWGALLVNAGALESPLLLALDLLTLLVWLAILRRRGLRDAAGAAGIAGVLVSPHAMVYDLCLWLAALPAVARRPRAVAVPLAVGSLGVPWLTNSILGQTWPAVLWAALSLLILLVSRPRTDQAAVVVVRGDAEAATLPA